MSDAPRTKISQPEFQGRIGVSRSDMTPPSGIYARSWGSAKHDQAEGVHQPLLASCIVFQNKNGGGELVLLAIDTMVLWQGEADKLRAAILSHFGLKPFQLIVHPSHSHGTPFLSRQHADRPGGDLIGPYLDELPMLCIRLIDEARLSASPATLGWAYGHCNLAYNRDSIDPATGRDICGLNTTPADDTVLVGRVTDDAGKIRATIVNYACHPVSLGGGNKLISPDYIGEMRHVVERHTDGAVCIFFHGASGDMTPRRSYEDNVEAAEQNGRELGFAALAALNGMFPAGQSLVYQGIEESGTALGIWRLKSRAQVNSTLSGELVTIKLPIKDMPTRPELEAQLTTATEIFEIERLERGLARRDLVGDGVEGDCKFTVWRLGEAFLVATPTEPYSQFQIDLREKFPEAAVAVLNASDGALNYLPKPASYNHDVYQVRVALYQSGCLETSTRRVAEAIARMT